MYDVLDICRYVIEYSNDKDYGISNLKLQKILYFIQAYCLIVRGKRCFREKIIAMDFGPVVLEAYREYIQYSSGDIPTIKTYIDFDEENIWNSEICDYDEDIISEKDCKLINEVIDKFKEYSATELVALTCSQKPWLSAYGCGKGTEITIESLKEYFTG